MRHQRRHGAGDYFPDWLRCSTIWGFRYQALQSNYRPLFVGWNVVLREVVHSTYRLACRLVVKSSLNLIVSGYKIPRGSKMVNTKLNIFLCVYSLAFRGNFSNVFIRKQSVLVFHYWPRTHVDIFQFISILLLNEPWGFMFVRHRFCQVKATFMKAIFSLVNGFNCFVYRRQRMDIAVHIKMVFCINWFWKSNCITFCATVQHENCTKWRAGCSRN